MAALVVAPAFAGRIVTGAGYSATDGVPYQFVNISGSGTQVLVGTDDGATAANIGFNFGLLGNSYSSLSISSNGTLAFGSAFSSFSNTDLSTVPSGAPVVAPLWDDWLTRGGVFYQTTGDPGSRSFIV